MSRSERKRIIDFIFENQTLEGVYTREMLNNVPDSMLRAHLKRIMDEKPAVVFFD